MPDGVVLLGSAPPPPPVEPVAGTPGWGWTPSTALPGPVDARPVDVFYTPHPDDETLSMAVLIVKAVHAGHRAVVVSLTDGRTTGAGKDIDARLRASNPKATPLTPQQLADDRIRELRRASARLGVAADDVVLAHLDAPSSDCGTRVTVAEAEAVIRALAQRFPGATHVTMSGVLDRHPDHLAAGRALATLVREGVVGSAQWTVSRLWWELPGPTPVTVLPDPAQAAQIRAAAQEYQVWDPAHEEYAVGLYSVRWQFTALSMDPRNRYLTGE